MRAARPLPRHPFSDGTLAMTILLLVLGAAFFGGMAGYVYFCERV
jgi:hypothetical protein